MDRKLEFRTSSFLERITYFLSGFLSVLPSEALRKRRKSLNFHFLVKEIEARRKGDLELLVKEEMFSDSHTMSEILRGDKDLLLPFRPDTKTLCLPRASFFSSFSSSSSFLPLRVSFVASASRSKSFFLRGDVTGEGERRGGVGGAGFRGRIFPARKSSSAESKGLSRCPVKLNSKSWWLWLALGLEGAVKKKLELVAKR